MSIPSPSSPPAADAIVAGPASDPAPELSCRFCGSTPAVDVTVRGHIGFLVIMKFLKLRGPFCRDCGTASVREMSADSLWQGWWSIGSLLFNPFALISNLVAMRRIRRLAPPLPGAAGTPKQPGKPLYLRPEIAGLLAPVLIVGAIVLVSQGDPDYADVGDCVRNSGSVLMPDVKVVDCGGSDAQYRIVGRTENADDAACKPYPQTDASYVVKGGRTTYTLCLAPVTRS
ncbi:hypothetical protein AB0K51_24225 [Kitasatospora sp. NPDC049285]|uniref:LppU/SCO3897 family protein n=1 Tax=Kitasatospora sp. NPDC049285 TaxID=3157096 RepID=UPI00341A1F5A